MNTATAVSGQQALETARRLLDPEDVLAAVPGAGGASMGGGLAGTALLHARLAATDSIFAVAATRHWAAAAVQAKRYGGGRGIFSSAGGLAASLITGTGYLPDPGPQQAAAGRAAQWLSGRALDLSSRHQAQLQTGDLATPWSVYDAISGLSGIGRVLLTAVISGHPLAEPGLLAALETLTTMIRTRHGNRPGWWLPADSHPQAVTMHPSGAATTGLAHGIAGPIALLSTAQAAGWSVAGQAAAIKDAAQWLLHWRDNHTFSWPPYVTGDELDRGTAGPAAGRRDAWCYGAPGIGRALSLAGLALTDQPLAEAGEAAIASLADRSAELWDVDGPTLCHGNAGVLQCAAASPAVTRDRAAAAVTAMFDQQRAFAFRHLENNFASDWPGLLTGAAGTALALADHGDLAVPTVPARWDSVLLLS